MAVYRAKEAFALPGPAGRVISAGSLMSDTDPDFKGREHLFEPVEVSVEREVSRRLGFSATETATAAPEEPVRVVTPPQRPRVGKRAQATPVAPETPAAEQKSDDNKGSAE